MRREIVRSFKKLPDYQRMTPAIAIATFCARLGESGWIRPPLATLPERERQKRTEIEDKLRDLARQGYYRESEECD